MKPNRRKEDTCKLSSFQSLISILKIPNVFSGFIQFVAAYLNVNSFLPNYFSFLFESNQAQLIGN